MRPVMLAFAIVTGVVLCSSVAQAQRCPASANEASNAIWPSGAVRSGRTVTGTHPCGRRITCTGGQLNVKGSRSCRWL
jgi:hypothetical protein